MTTLLHDVRYGLRVLWKSPGFTTVAVLSLALGVGANTAIFSIVNAVLLRSLPFPHPERLVKIAANNRGVGAQDIGFSVPELDDLRSRAGVFEQVTAIQGGPTNLTGGERPQHLEMLEVSPNYFSMLGTSPHIGRVFGPGDETQGFAEAVVISDSLLDMVTGLRCGELAGLKWADIDFLNLRLIDHSHTTAAQNFQNAVVRHPSSGQIGKRGLGLLSD